LIIDNEAANFQLSIIHFQFTLVKKILLVSPYWREDHRWMVSSYKLAELWQRLGFHVVVACMGAKTRTEKVSDTLTIHMRKDIFLPDPWNYGISFGFSGFVNKLVKEEKPDYIVINKLLFWTSLCAIGLKMRGHRIIQLTDALVGMTWWPRGLIPKICAPIYAWTFGWLILRCAERIVFFHPQPEALLKRLGISKKCEVIPTGIDPTSYEKRDARNENNNNNNSSLVSRLSTITYVGRLESVKGVDDFLAAAVPLKKEFPDLEVQVVGWYKEGHDLVEEYEGDVRFTGLRDDIPEILGASDIFVLPSYSEGLSNALMEAMASSCACVASEVGGNSYLIQNGVSGFLFPAGDRAALTAHLRRLLQDPVKRRAIGDAARIRIEDMFSWSVVGKRYHALFDTLGTRS
jgi:glycosyltransferase involved in cell wall biosynthesis